MASIFYTVKLLCWHVGELEMGTCAQVYKEIGCSLAPKDL